MASSIREKVTEWLTGADTCFLLGAGCSVCAGKPLIGDLTDAVLKDVDPKLKTQFAKLKSPGDRPPTVEDLITYLVKYRDILSASTSSAEHTISIEDIDEWLRTIKKRMVVAISDDWVPSTVHRRFLQRVQNSRPGRPRDIFSLNYDTVLEATLDELRLPYVDGFRGTNRAWFDPDEFDEATVNGPLFRLYKLHGSINWTRDESGHVRRTRNAADTPEPIVVFPSEQKYLQTQYGVYETLMGRFRNRLRTTGANNCLVVLGYSFNDNHINEAICDAVTTRNGNLTVVSFIGPETDQEKQIARLSAIASRCDQRFNAFTGDGESGKFVGHAVDEDAAITVIKAGLWRFESLVTLIAGEA